MVWPYVTPPPGSKWDTNEWPDCKTLAPTWEKLAEDFASEKGVLIAKVDCEAENAKATAEQAGVKSYPTINFYPKGSKEAIPYTGGRNEGDLINFMNEKAGTHRMSGGGLDTFAGLIPDLDSMATTLRLGGGEGYGSLVDAANALKDTYADYYARVAKKMAENEDYAEKELARIQKLLKKGGLARDKEDDLTSRNNILNKFLGYGLEKDEL